MNFLKRLFGRCTHNPKRKRGLDYRDGFNLIKVYQCTKCGKKIEVCKGK